MQNIEYFLHISGNNCGYKCVILCILVTANKHVDVEFCHT